MEVKKLPLAVQLNCTSLNFATPHKKNGFSNQWDNDDYHIEANEQGKHLDISYVFMQVANSLEQ